ncbi:MAG: methylmalonyl Co-A mutase-associated GTPase MeaB [Bacteroidetes bacterium]|nr:methylmalonyl Co-A mutase-associated GTPase MeaB [Bacteroidota bacterium]
MGANIKELLLQLQQGDKKALARCITIVENELEGYEEILTSLQAQRSIPIIGITGPPGAGKSTLINSVIKQLTTQNKKIGVIAIDPTSPFNFGSLLGDRLRMADHFNNENVFIRSLATRGSLGGLSAKIIEVVDVMKCFDFDYLFVETVGVGQSEVEIVGLADLTILVLVPESGDEVQTIKSGVMEIADIFVVNKSDRDGAGTFIKNIITLVHSRLEKDETEVPVIKAVATSDEGTSELIQAIDKLHKEKVNSKRSYLLTEKAYRLIQNKRMKDIHKVDLQKMIEETSGKPGFNLYVFVKAFG